MAYLSRNDIRQIAARVLRKYESLAPPTHGIRRIDPNRIAEDVLHLSVQYGDLPGDDILGVTSYGPVLIETDEENGTTHAFYLDGKTILIDKSLQNEEQRGRRNFTIAHETGHQILKLLFPTDYGIKMRKRVPVYYRAHQRKSGIADWEEWQADTLAVELLMPSDRIYRLMHAYGFSEIKSLNRVFDHDTYWKFCKMANFLGVSKEALSIRLEQLGLLEQNDLKNPYVAIDIAV